MRQYSIVERLSGLRSLLRVSLSTAQQIMKESLPGFSRKFEVEAILLFQAYFRPIAFTVQHSQLGNLKRLESPLFSCMDQSRSVENWELEEFITCSHKQPFFQTSSPCSTLLLKI